MLYAIGRLEAAGCHGDVCDYEIRIEKIKNGFWKRRKNFGINNETNWELVCHDTSLRRKCFLECLDGTPSGYYFHQVTCTA